MFHQIKLTFSLYRHCYQLPHANPGNEGVTSFFQFRYCPNLFETRELLCNVCSLGAQRTEQNARTNTRGGAWPHSVHIVPVSSPDGDH